MLIALAMVVGAVGSYFLYRLGWFALVGQRGRSRREIQSTFVGFAAVIVAVGLWFLGSVTFGSASWYNLHRWLFFAALSSCILAIVASRFAERRSAVAIIAFAVVVALNWIGTALSH